LVAGSVDGADSKGNLRVMDNSMLVPEPQSESRGEKLAALVDSVGFECKGVACAAELVVLEAVRDMCAADKCNYYDKRWSCPPACGTLDYFREVFGHYGHVLVFQTMGQMEDDFDFEGMVASNTVHHERCLALIDALCADDSLAQATFLLTAGACVICADCAYPQAPCKYPQRMRPSMEAAGLMVNDVCAAAGIPYYHGQGTITYTSCVLY
jgi:predicted metal-binding protein